MFGKSTVSKKLQSNLEKSVFLDGDWCWNLHPWNYSERNKKMVLRNIQYLSQSFIDNPEFDYVIFCWVLD